MADAAADATLDADSEAVRKRLGEEEAVETVNAAAAPLLEFESEPRRVTTTAQDADIFVGAAI